MKVLVLDGNENQAVASVRSLARAGFEVRVGAASSWSKAGWSRYCHSTFTYTAPERDAQSFVRAIAEEVRREPGTLVLPMTERSTLPLSAHRETIKSVGGRMVLPPHATVLRAFDKRETTRLAASLGIDTPQTALVSDRSQAREIACLTRYPVVLKPRSSEEVSATGKVIATGRPLYARNPEEFVKAFTEISKRCSSVLAQEFIEGEGAGYFALMREGELRAEFAHRRIRDVRPTGSGSSLRVSVYPDPELREAALKILKALDWHGVAMVEFRLRPDGTPVFLEVNGRFWTSLALAVYAGADFPALLARQALQGDVEPVTDYYTDIRCRWLLGDARHLLEVWRGAPAGYPGKFPGRLRATAEFFTPTRGTYHDNFMMRDPLPEIGDWLDFALRRLPARFKKGQGSEDGRDADCGSGEQGVGTPTIKCIHSAVPGAGEQKATSGGLMTHHASRITQESRGQ
ncbi:MAG: ATP-grasp domain-containing protein [Blastocatellia bacterium]|nr:ATP-grasp domain-containing protein [Blastocatellia bacterium]